MPQARTVGRLDPLAAVPTSSLDSRETAFERCIQRRFKIGVVRRQDDRVVVAAVRAADDIQRDEDVDALLFDLQFAVVVEVASGR